MPDDDFILPPIEREKHDELEVQDWREAGIKAGEVRSRVKWEKRDSLFVYYNLGLLGHGNDRETRLAAGMYFRMDWYALGKEPRVTARYADFINQAGSPEAWNDIRERAGRRYDRSARALGDKGLLTLVISVACRGEFMGPGRMKRLVQGLDILAKRG